MMTNETVLVLRTCSADLTSYNGFQWPSAGPVECPDWDATAECGNGLHGLLWGIGYDGYLDWSDTAKWLVVEVDASLIIDIDRKVKFPRGIVVYCGDRHSAIGYMVAHGADASKIVGGTATAGYGGTATAGDRGTATAGDRGIIAIKYYDSSSDRYRLAIGYVGENGILPNTAYRVRSGKLETV